MSLIDTVFHVFSLSAEGNLTYILLTYLLLALLPLYVLYGAFHCIPKVLGMAHTPWNKFVKDVSPSTLSDKEKWMFSIIYEKWGNIGVILVIGIIGPIVEELLFRAPAFIFDTPIVRVGVVLLLGIIWGGLHAKSQALEVILLLVISVKFAFAGLFVPILAIHIIHNFAMVILNIFRDKIDSDFDLHSYEFEPSF